MKIDDFQGELTDISARKEALVVSHRSVHGVCVETEVALNTWARNEGVVRGLVIWQLVTTIAQQFFLFQNQTICFLDTAIQERFFNRWWWWSIIFRTNERMIRLKQTHCLNENQCVVASASVLKSNILLLWYFCPERLFQIMKIDDFQGE